MEFCRFLVTVVFRFMIQKNGQTTTRIIKLSREIPNTPFTKSLVKCVSLGKEMFKNTTIRGARKWLNPPSFPSRNMLWPAKF